MKTNSLVRRINILALLYSLSAANCMSFSLPPPLTLSVNVTHVVCQDDCNNNGMILVAVTGGTPWITQAPYHLSLTKLDGPYICPCPAPSAYMEGWAHLPPGTYNVKATDSTGASVNQAVTIFVNPLPSVVPPFSEGFETHVVPPPCWTNTAVSGPFVWELSTATSGNGNGSNSAVGRFYFQEAGRYELKTMSLDISSMYNPILKFNYAYATYITEVDWLSVYYSTDYGVTWLTLLNMPGGINGILNTGGAVLIPFVPTATQWGSQTLPLPTSTNMIKFTAISAYGNNLYIDNIEVLENPTVPVNNTLQNITVAGNFCFNATNTITVAGSGTTFTVQSGGSATMIAGLDISYFPSTLVEPGGYMHGYISSGGPWCGAKSASIVTVPEGETEILVTSKSFFTIYPNPTTGGFSLETRGMDDTAELRVEMYGMHGDRFFSETLSGKLKYDLSLDGKPNGVYFIRVVTGKLTGTGKIIKQ